MRSMTVAALVAACALACVPAAGASSVFGVGGGWIGFLRGEHITHFSFSGHEGPNGDTGQFEFNFQDPDVPFDIKVDVDCVNAFPYLIGGFAWLSGPVTSVSPFPNFEGIAPGDRVALGAYDGGNPSAGVPVDSVDVFPEVGSCKDMAPMVIEPYDVQQGNVVVKTG